MIVRKFEAKDFDQIQEWAKQWGSEYKPSQLPKTGFIVDGIAAYFIYKTDSSVCFLEGLISNKEVSEEQKDGAILAIVEATLKHAAELGFDVAYATTDNQSVVFRAMQFGAKAEPRQVLLTKRLAHDPSL